MIEDQNFSTAEAAAYSRVPEGTLRYWRARDEGPASFRLGRRVIYRRSALDAWMEAEAAKTTRGGVA